MAIVCRGTIIIIIIFFMFIVIIVVITIIISGLILCLNEAHISVLLLAFTDETLKSAIEFGFNGLSMQQCIAL